MSVVRVLALLCVTAVCGFGADAPTTFQQAVDRAHAQQKRPRISEYSSQILMPFWQQRMGPIFQGCFKTVAQPDGKSFSFVATMGPNGKVTDVYVDHETNIYQCFVAALMAEQFPAPPESPYYLHIDMHFDPAPPSNGWPDGGPPLVVERNKYSYTFGVPEGWEFNFEQAYEHGASLAYFPKGGSFSESSSVIYATPSGDGCSGGCIKLVADLMSEVLRGRKAHSPELEVDTAEPIVTKDGVKASIRVLRGARDLRDPRFTNNEALAFIAHDQAIILVVLASRNPKSWQQDYAAFRHVVAGHMFFPCDLTVPCKK